MSRSVITIIDKSTICIFVDSLLNSDPSPNLLWIFKLRANTSTRYNAAHAKPAIIGINKSHRIHIADFQKCNKANATEATTPAAMEKCI